MGQITSAMLTRSAARQLLGSLLQSAAKQQQPSEEEKKKRRTRKRQAAAAERWKGSPWWTTTTAHFPKTNSFFFLFFFLLVPVAIQHPIYRPSISMAAIPHVSPTDKWLHQFPRFKSGIMANQEPSEFVIPVFFSLSLNFYQSSTYNYTTCCWCVSPTGLTYLSKTPKGDGHW